MTKGRVEETRFCKMEHWAFVFNLSTDEILIKHHVINMQLFFPL